MDRTQFDREEEERMYMLYSMLEDENKELKKIIRCLMSHLEHNQIHDICKVIKDKCESSHVYQYYYLGNRDYQE